MRTTVDVFPHDQAVLSALESIGHPVGFALAPEGALEAITKPPFSGPDYLILYPLNTGRAGGMADPYDEAELIYQVTVVGRLAAGVRWLVDKIEPALLGVEIPGRSVAWVQPDDDSGVRPDFDTKPPVLIATPRFRIKTVPT